VPPLADGPLDGAVEPDAGADADADSEAGADAEADSLAGADDAGADDVAADADALALAGALDGAAALGDGVAVDELHAEKTRPAMLSIARMGTRRCVGVPLTADNLLSFAERRPATDIASPHPPGRDTLEASTTGRTSRPAADAAARVLLASTPVGAWPPPPAPEPHERS
jgi:hypothetical protein